MEPLLKIGQVCRLYGITADTLRHYEKKGLLTPYKDPANGYRYYSVAQLDVIDLILAGKTIGIPLAQIGAVIAAEDVAAYRAMFAEQQALLCEQIARLERLRTATAARLQELDALADCTTSPQTSVTTEDTRLYLVDVETLFSLEADAPDTEGMASLFTWRLFTRQEAGVTENEEWAGFSFAPSAQPTALEQGFELLVAAGLAKLWTIPAGTTVTAFWGDDAALHCHLAEQTTPSTLVFVRTRYSLIRADGRHQHFVDIITKPSGIF